MTTPGYPRALRQGRRTARIGQRLGLDFHDRTKEFFGIDASCALSAAGFSAATVGKATARPAGSTMP